MIRKFVTTLIICLGLASVQATAQMTDDAVVAYAKDAVASGKSQDAIAQELLAKGVTKEQIARISNTTKNSGMTEAVSQSGIQERARRISGTMSNSGNTAGQTASGGQQIYGHDIFDNHSLTFAPNANVATPENYKLGPGDEVIIDIWGASQKTIRQTITPDGFVNIGGIGIIYLNGMNVKEADRYVRKQLSAIYSVDGENATSDIKLTLGALRTIQVNVMGEVKVPGTYFLSSLSSLYHAIYMSGGFTELSSVRNIELIRNGKKVADVDVYELLVNGNNEGDITLQEGDIVLVPTYEAIVKINGSVKRPMRYEIKEGETIASVLEYAGGFTGNAYTGNINVVRKNGREYQVHTVMEEDYESFTLTDEDLLSIGQILDRFENRIEIKGAVYRPGTYQLSDKASTVKELIEMADGLRGDAFTNRAIIQREREDYTLETLAIDIKAIMDGTAPDIELIKNDVLYISSIHDLNDLGTITVIGEVARPGTFAFAENTTIEDAIMRSGGLLESASTAKIEVSRRIKDAGSLEEQETIAEVFTFSFKDGYIVDGEPGFILQPYDQVFVRKSPSYEPQTTVRVEGEVIFPGSYTFSRRSERLSDLIEKAGGVNQWAYVKGARLSREMNKEEKARVGSTMDLMASAQDSLDMSMLNTDMRYYVGIDLEAALANPGSEADLVLRAGDVLHVPQYNNTVAISGNVLYPNTVTYRPDMSVNKYIKQAGGYGFQSKRSRAYIVYMNGTVAKARRYSKNVIEPGCEIVIPKKREMKEGTIREALGIATTASSIATMMATVGNLLR